MRVGLLTTVAAAALSLSLAAVAQTEKPAGAAGSEKRDTGTTSSGQKPAGAAGTASDQKPAGAAGAAGSEKRDTGTTSSGQKPAGAAGTATDQKPAGAAGTTGGTAGTGSVTLSGEQRTRAVQTLRTANIREVRESVTVSVGQTLPATITELHPCPETLLSLLTGIRECRVVLINGRYYIVEPGSRRVVTVIEG